MSNESLKPRVPTLVEMNEKYHLMQTFPSWLNLNRRALCEYIPETVIDKTSRDLIQIEDLHDCIDHAKTVVGSATLLRSLYTPLRSREEIAAKQESILELQANDKLASSIMDYLTEMKSAEIAVFRYLNKEVDEHEGFSKSMKGGLNLYKAALAIPQAESSYLGEQIKTIKEFGDSKSYKLMRGPIYRTRDGLKAKEDIHFYTPRLRYREGTLTRGTLLLPAVIIGLNLAFENKYVLANSIVVLYGYSLNLHKFKKEIDNKTVIEPLRKMIIKDPSFTSAIDAVGKMDELQSFIAFSEAFHPRALPVITDDPNHHFAAKELYNPILGKQMHDYVSNDVTLHDRLAIITGPNSGGKSTLGRSIVQNQLLAQIGSYVTARRATINIADRIAYQAPQYDTLQDREGRFGTEMERTKDIFYTTTPRSLVILDELAEGTTIEEKMKISRDLLDDFRTIGGTTIVMTHNHELAEDFQRRGHGHCLQVEFDGEKPTYRVKKGISKVSHAERVLEKIVFSKEDRKKYLREKGYQD